MKLQVFSLEIFIILSKICEQAFITNFATDDWILKDSTQSAAFIIFNRKLLVFIMSDAN